MLALSRYAIRHGVELKINWPGGLGVAPTMGAPFFAIAGVHWLALVVLYVGLALRCWSRRCCTCEPAIRSWLHRKVSSSD